LRPEPDKTSLTLLQKVITEVLQLNCSEMRKISIFHLIAFAFILILSKTSASAQECASRNFTFKPGEELVYIASYDWFVIWTEVAEVKMTITETEYQGKPVYHYLALGQTFKNWDLFFKVRDKFETYVDKETLQPYVSSREVREGNYKQNDKYFFNRDKGVVYSYNTTNDHPQTIDTLPIQSCTFDIMSAMLYARNIDFAKYNKGDSIPISVLLDKEIYPIYFRFLGVEKYKVKHVGEFECIKFSVLTVEGEMFHEGENMTVWVTNDKNRIPIYAESPVLVGSVRVQIADVKNNRYPFSSLKKK
jgi:hypothetical protein